MKTTKKYNSNKKFIFKGLVKSRGNKKDKTLFKKSIDKSINNTWARCLLL